MCCLFGKPVVKNGTKQVMFFDTPAHGRRVGVWVARQRYKCGECGKTIYQAIPHMHPVHDMTERLVQYIKTKGTETTFTALAIEIGVDVQTVRKIWRNHARKELDKLQPKTPEWLGIDELFLMRSYRGVITNVKERTLVDILPSRSKPEVVRYLMGLEDREKITLVAMDMWEPYRDAVTGVLPNAQIVVDRFHISRMASEAMARVRKELRLTLPRRGKLQLKDDRWMMLRAVEKLDATKTILLQEMLQRFPLLNEAWHAKESFRDIWQCTSREDAEKAYDAWCERLHPDVEPAFSDLQRAMRNWRKEVFNYFQWRVTNAYTESFNSVARKMDRMGRGYSFEALRAKLLLKHTLHKREPLKFTRSTPGPSLAMGLMQQPRLLGIDLSTLDAYLDTLPEVG